VKGLSATGPTAAISDSVRNPMSSAVKGVSDSHRWTAT
jgi:hypothetical protein